MAKELQRIRGVHNHYGTRDTGGGAGGFHSKGPVKQLEFELNGAEIASGFYSPVSLFPGYDIQSATLYVEEAFDITGDVEIRAKGTPADKITVAELDLESAGKAAPALAGGFAESAGKLGYEDTLEVVALGTVGDASVGKARVVVELIHTA